MKKQLTGFNLIELMVTITIIGIITVGFSNINFKSATDVERSNIFINQIAAIIEAVRINSLIGRIPEGENTSVYSWKIEAQTGTGNIFSVSYNTSDGGAYTLLPRESHELIGWEEIGNIKCLSYTGSGLGSTISSGSIIYQGSNISFPDCPPNARQIVIQTGYLRRYKDIVINGVNGSIDIR